MDRYLRYGPQTLDQTRLVRGIFAMAVSKLTVFLELRSRKTVASRNR